MKPTEKTRYGLLNNMAYALKAICSMNKSIVPNLLLYAATASLLPFVGILLPKALVQGLETGAPLSRLLWTVALLSLAGIVLSALSQHAHSSADMRMAYARLDVFTAFQRRVMDMDYALLEDPAVQDRINLVMTVFWNNNTGIEGALRIVFDQTPVLVSVLGMAALLTALHPLILCLLLLSAACSLALDLRAKEKEGSMQTALSDAWRKREYLSAAGQDLSAGKDIRIYRAKDYLLHKFDLLVEARARLETALQKARLPRVAVDALFTLLREGAVYAYLIWAILDGRLALSDAAMYFATVASFSTSLMGLLTALSQLVIENRGRTSGTPSWSRCPARRKAARRPRKRGRWASSSSTSPSATPAARRRCTTFALTFPPAKSWPWWA